MARIKKGWGQEDYYERLANEFLKKHAVNPYDVTEEEWNRAHLFDEKRLKQYAYESANYDPNLVYSKFQRINPDWAIQNVNKSLRQESLPYSRPITTLDIETDDFGRPITVSAIKTAFNKATGQMEIIDTYQRFYKSLDKNLRNTETTHGLTSKILNKFRKQQGAGYSWTYNRREQQALSRFLGNSVIVGHNAHEFDIPKLFGRRIDNQVVDTLIAARNIWGDTGKNSLDKVFKRVFGKTMEQAGLPHHDSMSDTIATAMIYEAMATSNTPTGDALRKVLKHADLNLAPFDPGIDIKHGGSQLIRGAYWRYKDLENAKYYVDKYGYTGEIPMENTRSPEELLSEQLGTSMQIHGREYGNVNPGSGDASDVALEISALAGTIKDLGRILGTIQTAAVDIQGFGSSMSQYRKAQYIQTLARAEYENMDTVADALGIPSKDIPGFRAAAGAIKQQSEQSRAFSELRRYYRQGLGGTDFVNAMRKGLSDMWGDWGPAKTEALERDQAYYEEKQARKKARYLRGIERKGLLTDEQMDSLRGLEGSYDDLVDATDGLIKKNQELRNTYEAIGRIKMYDPNQLLSSARGQVSGILGASQGVVPSFLLNPASRIADASFNYYQRGLTGFNAANRVWNSGIGAAVTGGLTAGLGHVGTGIGMALTGGVNAITQVVGNVSQARIEARGLEIQNTLNTLGAAVSWISAPFKILSKVTKTLIGSFTGLSWKLNNIMGSGLTDMSNMGNPLTELTGINYSAYQGTTMLDVASLFNKGSMNSIYENFANQQRALFTTGEVNQNRLIAASMLGMFDKVYVPSNDTEGQYNSMVNQLLANMKGQSPDQKARTMYLASQIDSNLPGLLRTANMLDVTDINQLTNPRGSGMYWRPISDDEERSFRWDQYEFGAARSQMGVTKMRFADKLWTALGKDLYNGFNRLADSALSGDWNSVIDSAVDMWNKFKEKFVGVWEGIKGAIDGKDGKDGWGTKIVDVFAKVGVVALEVVRSIANAWGQLVGLIADKAHGLISYLSTVSIKPHYSTKDGFSFEIRSIKDKMDTVDSSKIIDHAWSEGAGDTWQYKWRAKGSYEELARQLFPEMSEQQLSVLTVGDIRERLMNKRNTWTDPEGDARFLSLNGNEFVPDSPEAIDALLGLAKFSPGREFDAALFATGNVPGLRRLSTKYTGKKYGDVIRNTSEQLMNEIVNPVIDTAQAGLLNTSQRLDLNVKINDKNVVKATMENGELFYSKAATMLSDLVNQNLTIQVSQQR